MRFRLLLKVSKLGRVDLAERSEVLRLTQDALGLGVGVIGSWYGSDASKPVVWIGAGRGLFPVYGLAGLDVEIGIEGARASRSIGCDFWGFEVGGDEDGLRRCFD